MPRGSFSANRFSFHYSRVGKQATPTTLAKTIPLPIGGRTRFWDADGPGLHVLATPTGRVFKVRYLRAGVPVDFRIGRVEEWNLSDARDQAKEIRGEAQTSKPGNDPQGAKKKRRDKAATFGVLADRFLDSISVRPNTLRSYRVMVDLHLKPTFGNRNAESIARKEIRDHIERVGRKSPVSAARAFETMRRIYSWAVEHDELPGTPFAGLRKPDKVQEADSVERERVLTRAEVSAIFAVLHEPRFAALGFDHYVRLLFETAVRRDELMKATWREIDFDARIWTISSLRYKSKQSHQVPLTPAAIRTFESLRRAAGTSPYVFPGSKPSIPRVSPQRVFEALRKRVGFVDWRLHDIRRTVATELDRLGIAPHIREAILGHAKDKLTRTYSQHVPIPQMREALESWSVQLDRIVGSVIAFPARSTN